MVCGYPVKIGSPHFVDFGKNMEYSPDGKAYMVAHGAEINDSKPHNVVDVFGKLCNQLERRTNQA
ncbi:hypothetical protein FACS1894123_05460 [Bacteroidia bacterium]|nr:hypothetical protein FACS1894123_05460 [Bacteroidia bacterium]